MDRLNILEDLCQDIERNIGQVAKIIGELGDILILKVDGIRSNDKYSGIITFANGMAEPIRNDSDSINEALQSIVIEYIRLKKMILSGDIN